MSDRISAYLDVIPLPGLIAAGVWGLFLLLLIPSRVRLYVSIAVMVPWLTLGQLVDLGMWQAIAKATTALAFGAVALAAALHPGPRAKLPTPAWTYLVLSVVSVVFVLTVRDLLLALALRIQWIALVLAAVMVARTLTDRSALERMISALTVGLCIGMLLPASDLIRDPLHVLSVFGRLEPYGSSANQIGVVFASAVPFAAYSTMRSGSTLRRLLSLVCAVIAFGLTVLTASRSALVVATVPLVPLLLLASRKPLVLAPALLIGVVALQALLNASDARVERLESVDTERTEIAKEYIDRSIAQRPYFGLLETEGYSVLLDDETVGQHPHNAYLEMLYVGGLAYGLPMYSLVLFVLTRVWSVWRLRRYLDLDYRLVHLLTAEMVVIFAHGFVNGAIFYANAPWAWLHVFLAVWTIKTARELRTTVTQPAFTIAENETDLTIPAQKGIASTP